MSLDFVETERGSGDDRVQPAPDGRRSADGARGARAGAAGADEETLLVPAGREEQLDFAVFAQIFKEPLREAPKTIHDLAAIQGTDRGWRDALPKLYSFLALGRFERLSLRDREQLFVAMADGITWDGQADSRAAGRRRRLPRQADRRRLAMNDGQTGAGPSGAARMAGMDRSILWRAAAAQVLAVAALSLILAVTLPHSFFDDWGWITGPVAWLVCAALTAWALHLQRLRGRCSAPCSPGSRARSRSWPVSTGWGWRSRWPHSRPGARWLGATARRSWCGPRDRGADRPRDGGQQGHRARHRRGAGAGGRAGCDLEPLGGGAAGRGGGDRRRGRDLPGGHRGPGAAGALPRRGGRGARSDRDPRPQHRRAAPRRRRSTTRWRSGRRPFARWCWRRACWRRRCCPACGSAAGAGSSTSPRPRFASRFPD